MKKVLYFILGIILLAVISIVLANLFDQDLNPNVFTMADLPPASFDASNGFYIMWGLSEPEEVNLKSDAFTAQFRKLFHPRERDIEFFETFDHTPFRTRFNKYSDATRAIEYPRGFQEDWITKLEPQYEKIATSQHVCAQLLKRWRDLLNAPIVQDFTYPDPGSPIPNLLAVLRTAKLFTAISTAKAVRGQWLEGASDIIAQIDFARRFLRNGRLLIHNMIARSVLDISLISMVSLLNHPQCPGDVFTLVLEKLPPLKYEEYGNRNSFLSESLSFYNILDQMDGKMEEVRKKHLVHKKGFLEQLFLQVNATKNYFYEYYSMVLDYDRQDPYLWEGDLEIKAKAFIESKISGIFWKLKNPIGKIIFSVSTLSTVHIVIFKSMRARVRVDMLRILAELKLKYTAGQKVEEILPRLETYQTVDPGSGEPYKWNQEKKVLYSIGIDKTDDRGEEKIADAKSDIAIPVVLNNL